MLAKLVTDQTIGNGLVVAGGKLHANIGAGLKFNSGQLEADAATLPLTLTLANPAAAQLQANINGNLSNVLDLTPLIQAGETNTTLTYNPATKTLTYTNEDGVAANIDLSALAVDIFVSGGGYDPATMVLTLTDNDGTTPDIVINLADLKKVVTAASQSIVWSGTGEASSPLQAELKLDPLAGNLLKVTPSGVKVDPADIVVATDYGIDGNGQPGSPISFNAAELELHFEDNGNPNNTLVMSNPYRPEGTRVLILDVANEMWVGLLQGNTETYVNGAVPAVVAGMLTVDVQDLAGNHLFFARP